jgi:phospholipid/cholesterol/gamma-HCH transport system substrate-binding protein
VNRRGTIIKLIIFAAVSGLITLSVIATLLDLQIGEPQNSYRAVFTNATGLQPGDIVRVAGIEVGKVNSIKLDHDQAEVSFTVQATQHVTTATEASIDFQNLLGQRYLALEAPAAGPGAGRPAKPGYTIPSSQTHPGLDLTTVFTGFQPLLAALNPTQVNQLTGSIIAVLQGESGAVADLTTKTAQLTTNLAQRSTVIDKVLDNLTPLLTQVNTSDGNIGRLIDGLDAVVRSLNTPALPAAISGASALAANTSSLLANAQPFIDQDFQKLAQATGVLEANEQPISNVLANLTPFLKTLNKVSDSGSYLSVYVCDLTLNVSGPVSVDLANAQSPDVNQSPPITLSAGVIGTRAYHFRVCS